VVVVGQIVFVVVVVVGSIDFVEECYGAVKECVEANTEKVEKVGE
jgi:hypothetical protein